MTITITLNDIRAHGPCQTGWEKLLKAQGKTKADDGPFPLSDILETNGLEDCLWALCCTPEALHPVWRKFAVWAARQVEHLMTDDRSKEALEVAWRHSDGVATDEELAAAWNAARDATRDAGRVAARVATRDAGDAARDAGRDAGRDAVWGAARAAARAAARDAAWNAAWDAAGAAARAAWAASDAARDAARDAAGDAARDTQARKLKQILDAGEWIE